MIWQNQFASVPQDQRARTTIEMPRKTEAQLKQYEPKTGVLQTTISILIQKLSDELTKSNLTAGDRAAFQHAVANATFRLPDNCYPAERSAVVKPTTRPKRNRAAQAVGGDDGLGATTMAQQTPGLQKPSDV